MKPVALAFALLLTGLAPNAALAQAAPPTTAMTPTPDDRAKQWLTLVDDANYGDSYKQMGALATGKITADAWTQKLKGAREPLGAMSSRDIKDIKLSKTLPGAPDGQYAIVQYNSAFAHKAAAVETVILSSGKDGWSVVSYFIN